MKSNDLQQLIEETLYNEVKGSILSENKKKEVFHIKCDGKPLATFDSKQDAKVALPKLKKKHPGQVLIIEKSVYESYADMIEDFDKMSEELDNENMKNTKEMKEMESLDDASGLHADIEQGCKEEGCKAIAIKLIDGELKDHSMGDVTIQDIPHDETLKHTLKEIEFALEKKDFPSAIDMAKSLADDLLSEIGFDMADEEGELFEKEEQKDELAEGLSEESITKLKAACEAKGCRRVAKLLVDKVLASMTGGMTSSDLADTEIFADGLDEIESLLENEDFQDAFNLAKEVASDMLSDEGMEMEMDENWGDDFLDDASFDLDDEDDDEFTSVVGRRKDDSLVGSDFEDEDEDVEIKKDADDSFVFDGSADDGEEDEDDVEDEEEIELDDEDEDMDLKEELSSQDIANMVVNKAAQGDEEMTEDLEEEVKGMCSECGKMITEEGATMCSECGTMKESKGPKIRIKESQLRRVVSNLIAEAMKGQPGTPGVVGKTIAARAGKGSGKEAQAHYKEVEKKMKDYLGFEGNTNPEFPHQMGGERMAIHPSKEQAEEIAKNKAGLQNLDYDMEPSENFKKRLDAALKGDTKMGNSAVTGKNSVATSNGAKAVDAKEKSGNTIPTETDKVLDKQIKDRQKDKDERELYNRAAVPTKNLSESVLGELDKMKHLSGYNKKTQ